MGNLTVVCWSSEAYASWSAGLQEDARRLGYGFHHYKNEAAYNSAVDASLNHPRFALQAVHEFDRVLFCDVECRLLREVPDWRAPSIAVRSPTVPFHLYYNSGTMLIDRTCITWLESWIRVIERFRLSELNHDHYYLRSPGDLCDELALHSALAVHGIRPFELRLECVDRSAPAEIARGYWSNQHTVIQHPTLQHWPKAQSAVLAKRLFLQNFPGNPDLIPKIFLEKLSTRELDGWHFDGRNGTYCPTMYRGFPMSWTNETVQLSSEEL